MKKYIEREAARNMIEDWSGGFDYIEESVSDAIADLGAIPAADVVEVRHGRWVNSEEDGHPSICCVCNYSVDRFYKTKYCPNCGAKMDGGADDAAD